MCVQQKWRLLLKPIKTDVGNFYGQPKFTSLSKKNNAYTLKNAKNIRDTYANYFNSKSGEVSYQYGKVL